MKGKRLTLFRIMCLLACLMLQPAAGIWAASGLVELRSKSIELNDQLTLVTTTNYNTVNGKNAVEHYFEYTPGGNVKPLVCYGPGIYGVSSAKTIFRTEGYKDIEYRLKARLDDTVKKRARAEESILQYFGDAATDPERDADDDLRAMQDMTRAAGKAWEIGRLTDLLKEAEDRQKQIGNDQTCQNGAEQAQNRFKPGVDSVGVDDGEY